MTRVWKDFLVSAVDLLKASGVLDRDILASHCVLYRFYIFSYKYKSSKPSIVEYIYQVKDNIKTEKQISIIKGKEENFEEKRKQIIHKGVYLSELSFFLLLLKKNPIWTDSK